MNRIAQTWSDYFEFVGFDNHPELGRFALWLTLKGYTVEQVQREGINTLAEEEQEHFLGQYNSPAEFTQESYQNAYGYELDALPNAIENAIDWAKVWDSEMRHDCIDIEIDEPGNYGWLIWHTH